MPELNTSAAGYGDSAKLQAAKELQQIFKKAPYKGKGGLNGDTSSTTPNWASLPRPYYQQNPPPPLSVPPPSQRQFSGKWVPDPAKTRSGPIMGKKALDFLNRQDANVDTEDIKKTAPEENPTVQDPLAQPIEQGNNRQTQGKETDLSTSTKATTPAAKHPEAGVTGQAFTSEDQVFQPVPNFSNFPKSPGSDGIQDSQSQSERESAGKRGILDTFFSLLDVDLDGMPEGLMPSLTSKPPSVANDSAVQEPAKSPNQLPVKREQGAAFPKMGMRGTTTSPMQSQSRGKINGNEIQRDKRLRPEAPGFIPSQTTQETPGNLGGSISSVQTRSSSLSTSALKLTPLERDVIPQGPVLPVANHVMQTGPAIGHMVSVTPVQVTNGVITPGPGPATGTLWLQMPVAINQAGSTPLASTLSPAPSKVMASGFTASKSSQDTPEKSTVGLKGSMWA